MRIVRAADVPNRSIAIVGGGVAGWLAAATLGRVLKKELYDIRLIETRGEDRKDAGESTIPAIHRLHNLLGFNEADLMRRTQATFKLGAEFRDWGKLGDRYLHAFGSFGAKLETVGFHHYWLKLRQAGDARGIENYSMAAAAAKQGKFAHPSQDKHSALSLFAYAYHLDAELYASYLREYAQTRGVARVESSVREVTLRGEDGFIDALVLDNSELVEADLYIDCSGGGRLIEEALETGREDWRQWLACDRAVCASADAPVEAAPVTQMVACPAGWQWRVPLQHRVDGGYTYCSDDLSDDEAATTLMRDLGGASTPRFHSIRAGRPRKFWNKNCLALPSTMEALEATGLHLVQTGIMRLLTVFPDKSSHSSSADEYNRLTILEHDSIRDLLILHYTATTRNDSAFWRSRHAMPIPDGLRRKIALFESSGRVAMRDGEHFNEESWLAVLLGQNIMPRDYDPIADVMGAEDVRTAFARMEQLISESAGAMPSHQAFIDRYCRAEQEVWS